MDDYQDIGVVAVINILTSVILLVVFSILRHHWSHREFYFPRRYRKEKGGSPTISRSYLRIFNWVPAALRMSEAEVIDQAGLDSAVYLRIYLLGLKIFVPITVLSFFVLVPVNYTGESPEHIEDLTFSTLDKFSISNVPPGSRRNQVLLVMAYVFSFLIYYEVYKEDANIATMRLRPLACESLRPDRYSVLVKNIPADPDKSIDEKIKDFFCKHYSDNYLTHKVVYNVKKLVKLVEKKKGGQNWHDYYRKRHDKFPGKSPITKTGFCGLWGPTVDAVAYYKDEVEKLNREEAAERKKVFSDPKFVVPAAFVSFKTRWGAAKCSQTQQSNNPTYWVTEQAPEPRDIYWQNLTIRHKEVTFRRLFGTLSVFLLLIFFMIPIKFVQYLADNEENEIVPSRNPLIETMIIQSVIKDFLPGIILNILLMLLPRILMFISKFEGLTSISALDRRAAWKYYLIILFDVFVGSIFAETIFQQLRDFINQSPTEIPMTVLLMSIPKKATFFLDYIMISGLAGMAAEILRFFPLVQFHINRIFLVKTELDREQAAASGGLAFPSSEAEIQLYVLLGNVYAVVNPLLLPGILLYFALGYLVYRHQIIHVYIQRYETKAKFWTDVRQRFIISLFISQLLLMGYLSTRDAGISTPFLAALPMLTICFGIYCEGRSKSEFEKSQQDIMERAGEANQNLSFLQDAYVHPVLQGCKLEKPSAIDEDENKPFVPV